VTADFAGQEAFASFNCQVPLVRRSTAFLGLSDPAQAINWPMRRHQGCNQLRDPWQNAK
jgi:hypothetical protein